jgi:hypothetical protein
MSQFKTFFTVTHGGGPVGIALKRHALLYTVYTIAKDGDPTIFKVTDKGAESVFAPKFPSIRGNAEVEIVVNPGRGPWEDFAGYVYATQGSKIFEITPDGNDVKLFVQIPPIGNDPGTCITFDQVGTFCYDMILGDAKGNVYRADPSMRGTTLKPFANVKNQVLGDTLEVVPKCLGPHGGEIWVTAENQGKVYSISASVPPIISPIVDIPRAGNIAVIPNSPKELGCSGGAFFTADWPTQIVEFPKSVFRGLGGNVLVGQENGRGLYIVKFDRNLQKYVANKFGPDPFKGIAEGAAFVRHHHDHDDDHHYDDDDEEYESSE